MGASVPTGIFWSLRASMDGSGSSLRSLLAARRSPPHALGECSYHPPQIVRARQCAAASICVQTRARLWNSVMQASARLVYEPFDPRDGVHTLGLLPAAIHVIAQERFRLRPSAR